MKKQILSVALTGLLSATLVAPFASANIHLSGFASVVGGKKLSASDTDLYGYDDSMDFKQGSLVALQASSDLGDGLGVTVQLTANGAQEWQPKFKWAYVSYDASDKLRILAGRQIAPFYMYSDYLDVSYAYPWITPPEGVYDLIIKTFDGLGAIYNTHIGDTDLSFHGIYGRNTDDIEAFGQSATLEVNDIVGMSATATYDWLTLRAAYFVAEASMPFADLDDAADVWKSLSPHPQLGTYASLEGNTRIHEDDASFFELGFQANLDKLILVGEYTKLVIDNTPLAEETSYYLMAGYQFENVLAHITFGVDDNTADPFTENVPLGVGLDDLLLGETVNGQRTGGINGFIATQNTEEQYITIGARYDFTASAALKFEYTSFTDDNNSNNDSSLFRTALVTVF